MSRENAMNETFEAVYGQPTYFAWLPEKFFIPRMTDDEIRAFVDDYRCQRVFTSANIRDNQDLGMVFMCLAFGAFENWPREKLEEIGVVWEYMKEAMPRSMNGYPVFMSLQIMHRDDWKRAVAAIQTEEERRRTMPLPEVP